MEADPSRPQPDREQTVLSIDHLRGQEERLADRRNHAQETLGRLVAKSEMHRDIIYGNAITLGERVTTDPYSPDRERVRPEEGVVAKQTLGRYIGRLARRFSVLGPNSAEIREPETRDPHIPNGIFERSSIIRAAKRNRRQEIRQEEAKYAERIFSGGIGLGEQSKSKTLRAKSEAKRDLRSRLGRGDLSAEEYVSELEKTKHIKVYKPAKAVSREIRQERLHGIYNTTKSSRLISRRVNQWRQQRTQNKIEKIDNRLAETERRRMELEESLED